MENWIFNYISLKKETSCLCILGTPSCCSFNDTLQHLSSEYGRDEKDPTDIFKYIDIFLYEGMGVVSC